MVTLNDLERRDDRYFTLSYRKFGIGYLGSHLRRRGWS